ncbi:hypothetical protein [Solicola gregarius]|uniref:Uncharacterized protein n=1 Tax=Solicola gregarius TaxID=2908642 RepID=A0AA46YIU8_9ACTN|nr:hypothetical protein [Solicola gregarius]UYM03570.1 hypothetical protein L0C25_13500 [Solicola gregarius]
MSVLKRVAIGAAATALVTATIAAGGPASASEIKIKGKVAGSSTVAKSGDTLTLPRGASLKASLFLPSGKIRKGVMDVPTITAHMDAKIPGLDFLPGVPMKAKVNMVQVAPITGKVPSKGKNKGHMVSAATVRFAIPKATLDVPIPVLDGINIVQDTCTTEPFKIKMISNKKLNLDKKIIIDTKFTIPKFDGCSIVNVPPFGLRNTLLTQLLSGPGNTLHLEVGPLKSDL